MAAESELDRLDPQPVIVKLESGLRVDLVRLKTRQLFRLLRILTHGVGPALGQLDFTAEDFGPKLLGAVVMAIPDAEQEVIAFLQSMGQPHGLAGGVGGKRPAQLTKQESEDDQALWDRFQEELFNPEPDDLISMLEAIIEQEAPELQALGKKLQHLWEIAKKAGNFGKPEKAPEAQDLHLPEPMQNSSTSSPASTAGPTSTSLTSPSADSASARKRRTAASAASS